MKKPDGRTGCRLQAEKGSPGQRRNTRTILPSGIWGYGEDDTIHPILICADLVIAIGEQRTMETARMIHGQFLDRYLGQD
jgi:hypothetical protein